MSANETQVAGSHYKSTIQHWDYVVANDLDYFQAQITKYVTRWKKKNGMTDLRKAQHFLEKYIEVQTALLDRNAALTGGAATPAAPPRPTLPISRPAEQLDDQPTASQLHPA